MTDLRRDKIIFGILAVMTVGVLVSRNSPQAGFVVSMAGLVLLFLSGAKRAFGGVVRYRRLPPLTRAWIALQGIQLIVIVNSLVVQRVSYFPVLLILAAEYFIWDSESRR